MATMKLAPFRTLPQRARNRALSNRAIQALLLPFGHDINPERWIFIVGCYNSGTTLLHAILKQHPDIGSLPDEGTLMTKLLPQPENFGWTRMWCKCLEKVRLEPGSLSPELINEIKRQWSIWYGNKPNLLEKSIANTARTPFLQEHFSPAYFVYLIRDGYAVAEGIRRKSKPSRHGNSTYYDRYPIELCAEQWHRTDLVVSEDAKNLRRLIRVKYEDLTANPDAELKRITEFLGIRSLSQSVIDRRWTVHDTRDSIKNMNGSSFKRLKPEDLDAIEKVAAPTLAKYGYERPNLD